MMSFEPEFEFGKRRRFLMLIIIDATRTTRSGHERVKESVKHDLFVRPFAVIAASSVGVVRMSELLFGHLVFPVRKEFIVTEQGQAGSCSAAATVGYCRFLLHPIAVDNCLHTCPSLKSLVWPHLDFSKWFHNKQPSSGSQNDRKYVSRPRTRCKSQKANRFLLIVRFSISCKVRVI
jgi:hypothetical protein